LAWGGIFARIAWSADLGTCLGLGRFGHPATLRQADQGHPESRTQGLDYLHGGAPLSKDQAFARLQCR